MCWPCVGILRHPRPKSARLAEFPAFSHPGPVDDAAVPAPAVWPARPMRRSNRPPRGCRRPDDPPTTSSGPLHANANAESPRLNSTPPWHTPRELVCFSSIAMPIETLSPSRFSYNGPTSALNGLKRSINRNPSGITGIARDFSGEQEPGAGGERRQAE